MTIDMIAWIDRSMPVEMEIVPDALTLLMPPAKKP